MSKAKVLTPCAFCGEDATVPGGIVMGMRDNRFRIMACPKHVHHGRALWTTYNALCGVTLEEIG